MNLTNPGGDAAGPLKERKGWASRRNMDDSRLSDARPIVDPRRAGGCWAGSLDQLRDSLGAYGHPAVYEARLCAMIRWLMEPYCKLSDELPVVREALNLAREHNLARVGLPTPDRGPRLDVMPRLAADLQGEAYRVVTRFARNWHKAKRPFLTRDRIKDTHMYVLACIRAIPEQAAA